MKRYLPGILALSLVAGIGVVAGLMSPEGARRAALALFRPAEAGPTVAGIGTPLTGGGGAGAAGNTEIRLADAWKTVQSVDLKSLIANLRAAGFPPAVIRAIVAARLDEQYAARRRQIVGDQPPPYWKAGSMLTSPQMAALRQLAREEQDTLKQLLGPDSATAEWTHYMQQRMYGPLPADKIDMIQRIQSDYGELRSQVYSDATGVLLPWDREKLAVLDQEQRADLTAALTPDELRQYDLYSSPTAQRLRNQLAAFNPTEQEFLAIYDLQSQFDQQYNSPATVMGMLTPDQLRQRQVDQQQLQAQIKAALGDERYVAYEQSTDPGFQAASRIVGSLQLPAANAAAAWTLQQTIQQQATAIRSDRSVPAGQRMDALVALDTEANQQLTTLLTQPGVDAYKQTAGGIWLRSLDMTLRLPVRAAAAAAPPPTH